MTAEAGPKEKAGPKAMSHKDTVVGSPGIGRKGGDTYIKAMSHKMQEAFLDFKFRPRFSALKGDNG